MADPAHVHVGYELVESPCGHPIGVWLIVNRRRIEFLQFRGGFPFLPRNSQNQMPSEDWAEDHGYVRYKCSHCGRTFWTDGEPDCCKEQESDDEKDDE